MSPKKQSSSKRRTKPSDRDLELGREIAKLRKALRHNQDRVADDLGISKTQYGKYERGETPMRVTVYEEIKAHLGRYAESSSGLGFSEEMAQYLPPPGHVDAKLRVFIATARQALDDIEQYVQGR